MILEIDYGNTRLKWRLLTANSLQSYAAGSTIDLASLGSALESAGCSALTYCRVCSVRSLADNQQLSALIRERYQIEVMYAQSVKHCAGVTNGYLQEEKLGVDRWLAVLAAYAQIQGACLVFDCGTAITVDFIRANGLHLGGSIAPGFRLLMAALQNSTQLSVDVESALRAEQGMLGKATQKAVSLGITSMLNGFIKEQLQLAQSVLGRSFVVICTGGDSHFVRDIVTRAIVQDDLVFAGLAIACPYLAKE